MTPEDVLASDTDPVSTTTVAIDTRSWAWPFRLHVIPVPADLRQDPPALRMAYRAFELLATGAILLVALPIMVIEAVIIRLDSPGPALFWQQRMGRSSIRRGAELMTRRDLIPPEGGFEAARLYLVPETIRFVKFRTMFVDARVRFPELYDIEFADHAAFMKGFYKGESDPRVTRVGRILRKTTVDELPNLLLVFRGTMALVGPRPEDQRVKFYTPDQMMKFTVKPGVTGLAQASGRGRLSIGEQIACDLEYVRTRSVWLDLQILIKTFIGVLIQKGAF